MGQKVVRTAAAAAGGAVGPALIPVLQQTGIAELVYGVGLPVGPAVGR